MRGKIDKQTEEYIEGIVERKLIELLGDPDEGLELRKEVKDRLKRSLKHHGKGVPAKSVAKELGLKW